MASSTIKSTKMTVNKDEPKRSSIMAQKNSKFVDGTMFPNPAVDNLDITK